MKQQQQALDRERKAALRDAQTMLDVHGAKIQAETDEKKRVDEIYMAEIQAEEKKRSDEIQIQIQLAKIEADKELTLKEMELKAQTSINAVIDPPPHNRDTKLQAKKDELDSHLLHFERTPRMLSGRKNMWAIKLSALLTLRAIGVYIWISNGDAKNYYKLKNALLTRYNFTEDGYRKRGRARG